MGILSKKTKKVSGKHLFPVPQSALKLTLMFSIPFAAILSTLFIALVLWEKRSHDQDLITELRETARAYFEQIMLTRQWNSEHGGVYAKVTAETQPNPYLHSDPERDIETKDGMKFTKINPAYMTRQLAELASEKGIYKFHITSRHPVNPQNKPDEWEIRQLNMFATDKKKEAYEVVSAVKGERFRYMAPLYVEESCVKCHSKYGYKLGDLRGGISIDIPMDVPKSTHMALVRRGIFAYGVVGIISLFFITGITWFFSNKITKNIAKELENERLKTAIQLAGAAAHELRQPMTAIIGFTELLKDNLRKGEPLSFELEVLVQQCLKMNEIIKKMLNITEYKTKTYSEDTEIFDLDVPPDEPRKENQQS